VNFFTIAFFSGPNQSGSALIGQDLWKQLKRVSVPTFSGEKKDASKLEGSIHSLY